MCKPFTCYNYYYIRIGTLSLQITSESVVQSYIDRIKEIQPVLNCIVEDRFEDALKDAKKCDDLLKSKNAPSPEDLAKEKPFFGVPFSTKACLILQNITYLH